MRASCIKYYSTGRPLIITGSPSVLPPTSLPPSQSLPYLSEQKVTQGSREEQRQPYDRRDATKPTFPPSSSPPSVSIVKEGPRHTKTSLLLLQPRLFPFFVLDGSSNCCGPITGKASPISSFLSSLWRAWRRERMRGLVERACRMRVSVGGEADSWRFNQCRRECFVVGALLDGKGLRSLV